MKTLGTSSASAPRGLRTVADLLRRQVETRPHAHAYTYLASGEQPRQQLTFSEVDTAARILAARIRRHVPRGARVLLVHPSGLEFVVAFFASAYAGVMAVPAYVPDVRATAPTRRRFQSIVKDCEPSLLLTSDSQRAFLAELCAQDFPALPLTVLANTLEARDDAAPGDAAPEDAAPGDVAFLQYTSGSTAEPRGVMVTHRNILENERMIQLACGHTSESTFVGWLPVSHDMGLIGNVLQPMAIGAHSVLMSPLAFVQKPIRWLRAIAEWRAATSGGPNFAYDLCVHRIAPEECEGLDLSGWTTAFNGAEPIQHETLERFAQKFERWGFRRPAFFTCYGLAETTLIASGGRPFAAGAPGGEHGGGHGSIASSGRPVADTRLAIVDPETARRCAAGEHGEIWIASPSVAAGYWNNPEETRRTFGGALDGEDDGTFLRTGDLGRIEGATLYVTGRVKDLIIIRGQNHFPVDIEWTVRRSHPALASQLGVAFSVPGDDEERLTIVQSIDQKALPDPAVVCPAIRAAVAAGHALRVAHIVFVPPGAIAKTTSGKVQRLACRDSYLRDELPVLFSSRLDDAGEQLQPPGEIRERIGGLDRVEREDAIQHWLAARVAAVLGVAAEHVARDATFVALGLDSLACVNLMHQLCTEWRVEVPIGALLDGSIASLAALLATRLEGLGERAMAPALVRAAGADTESTVPLSAAQKALLYFHDLVPASTAYTIARAFRIERPVDVEALWRALRALAERHAALRTVVEGSGGDVRLRVLPSDVLMFTAIDGRAWTQSDVEAWLATEAARPFRLRSEPPLRASAIERAGDVVLFVSVHHSATDLWSFAIMLRELARLYGAALAGAPAALPGAPAALPELAWTSSQHAAWQGDWLRTPEAARELDYWQNTLAGDLPILELPADAERPPVQTQRGVEAPFTLGAPLTARLDRLARECGVTRHTLLLAAWQVLLHRLSQQADLIVGSTASGRVRPETADVVGYLANTLPIRTSVADNPTFRVHLARVRERVLEAMGHQQVPFAAIVERLKVRRDSARNPVFQAMFVMQGRPAGTEEAFGLLALGHAGARSRLGPLTLESLAVDAGGAPCDLTLLMAEDGPTLKGTLKYSTDLFAAPTAARLIARFETLLEAISVAPDTVIAELPLVPAGELAVLRTLGTGPGVPVALPYVHGRFERAAREHPDRLAVVVQDEQISYDALNAEANKLARHLRHLGVGSEAAVLICLDRSIAAITSILAVLKAGGAFVPMDPLTPDVRLRAAIRDAAVRVVITTRERAERFGEDLTSVVCIDADAHRWRARDASDLATGVSPEQAAYVIFTSGTTGVPKGVAIGHGAVVNLFEALARDIHPAVHWHVAVNAPCWFDASIKQIIQMLGGHTLFIVPDEIRLISRAFVEWLRTREIDALDVTPSQLRLLLSADLESAAPRTLLIGGEAIDADLWQRLAALRGTASFNVYGPSECTVDTTTARITPETAAPTIGAPIANVSVAIMDRAGRPLPLGVPGELCIGGAGVGRGYVGRPDQTAAVFVPDPEGGGQRLYRSGDLARWTSAGTLEYLGRRDRQVKVRGYRIELQDIEHQLCQHEQVRSAAVTIDRQGSVPALIAYVVLADGQADLQSVRYYLRGRVPEYMMPAAFVGLEAMPLTRHGKVDFDALPAPSDVRSASAIALVGPRNELEEVLVSKWAAALQLREIGIHDNFFELGGHSLLAAQLLGGLQDLFMPDPPLMAVFFQEPTLATVADAIAASLPSGMDLGTAARLVREGAGSDGTPFMTLADDACARVVV